MSESKYNPDVLSCLANLSNDEVFTPPNVVNNMLDMLPQELFESKAMTFLDIGTKSGVFLREIAKRLIKGLESEIPDLQKRVDHILHKQLFGIATTELTSLVSRRTLYCSKYPNCRYSASLFDTVEGNIRFRAKKHDFVNGRCKWCGASAAQFDRDDGLESHAYEFIHTDKPQEIFNMKFDVIVGNPPYQLADGGGGASAKSIYHLFVQQAQKLNPRFLTMIVPARWYTNGKGQGMNEFRKAMLCDNRISSLVDFKRSEDCFPGVNVAGGICYFLWKRDYCGICHVTNKSYSLGNVVEDSASRYLNEYDVLVRDNSAVRIIRKIGEKKELMLNRVVKSYSYFAVRSFERGSEKRRSLSDVCLLSSQGRGFYSLAKIVDKEGILNKYKVIITYAMSGGNKPSSGGDYQVVSSLQVLRPGEVCTETYLILGVFDKPLDAKNMATYVQTKFFRFLLLQSLTSIHITKDSFQFVPMQDFSKPWVDEELYKKYNLTADEIKFIESMIKPME